MKPQDLRALLERIGVVRHACDLDLLLFFYRHPRALLTGEKLVTYLGYGRDQVVKSLDALIEAGLVTRAQNPAHTSRLYILQLDALPGGVLRALLEAAATRPGRVGILRLLDPGSHGAPAARLRRAAIRRIG